MTSFLEKFFSPKKTLQETKEKIQKQAQEERNIKEELSNYKSLLDAVKNYVTAYNELKNSKNPLIQFKCSNRECMEKLKTELANKYVIFKDGPHMQLVEQLPSIEQRKTESIENKKINGFINELEKNTYPKNIKNLLTPENIEIIIQLYHILDYTQLKYPGDFQIIAAAEANRLYEYAEENVVGFSHIMYFSSIFIDFVRWNPGLSVAILFFYIMYLWIMYVIRSVFEPFNGYDLESLYPMLQFYYEGAINYGSLWIFLFVMIIILKINYAIIKVSIPQTEANDDTKVYNKKLKSISMMISLFFTIGQVILVVVSYHVGMVIAYSDMKHGLQNVPHWSFPLVLAFVVGGSICMLILYQLLR